MYEVEIKVRADHERVSEALAETGAELRGAVRQVDTYYDAPHRDFAETDEALRVRAEQSDDGERTRLTYKGPLFDQQSKTRSEIETGIEDGDDVGAILEALGFRPAATVEKERERYALDGYVVTLDAVSGLGEFVEVETMAVEDSIETAREGAYDVLRRLDLDPDEGIRTSYLGMLLGNY